MMMDRTQPGSHPDDSEPDAGEPPAPDSGVKASKIIGKARLEALRCELDEADNHWPAHMAATINEDYRQLMEDFGLR